MLISPVLLLCINLASSAITPRDIPSSPVFSDLKKVDTDCNKLTSAISSWNGQVSTVGTVTSAESALESDIKSATSDTKASSTFSPADSQTLVNYCNGTLGPDAQKACRSLASADSKFKSVGLTGASSQDRKNLKADFDALFAALVSKVPAAYQSQLKSTAAGIDNACDPNAIGTPTVSS